MAKQTLLELTQDILAAMDSDEVNSISDTVESDQVARCIRRAFYDFVTVREIPEHLDFFELEASGDNQKPVLMTIPSDVLSIQWLKYDKKESGDTKSNIKDVTYLTPKDFIDLSYRQNTDNDDTDSMDLTVDSDTIPINYKNDQAPNFWTSFDDSQVIFDAFDSDIDTTLQKSKTVCYGLKEETFSLTDGFTPNLDPQAYRIFANEALNLCFTEIKQAPHEVANRNARRGLTALLKRKSKARESDFSRLPNYGR